MDSAPTSVSVHIIGQVQGVGFRAWTEREARALGLTGWVANEADGSVRAVITGGAQAVELMLERLAQGPRLARVDRVLTTPADPADSHSEFRITG